MKPENLFAGIPPELPEELISTILQAGTFRVERIVSHGQSSPPGFWYDQDQDEWVLVIEGSATVQIEGAYSPLELQRGSYLHIPAHTRHRVAWTDPKSNTIWLAIHYENK